MIVVSIVFYKCIHYIYPVVDIRTLWWMRRLENNKKKSSFAVRNTYFRPCSPVVCPVGNKKKCKTKKKKNTETI